MDVLLSVLRAVTFGASISIASVLTRRCGSIVGPRGIPFRPPDWAFGPVWSCLYVTTGAAWTLSGARADGLFLAITLQCCWWLVSYICLSWRKLAAVTLASIACTATVLSATLDTGRLVAPLALWTAFGAYLNAYEQWWMRVPP